MKKEWKIIINGRIVSNSTFDATLDDAIDIARKYASRYAEGLWRYKGAFPNSVLILSSDHEYHKVTL